MMIVDAQIHLWSKGTPSAHHRQTPFLKEEALTMMDAPDFNHAVVRHALIDAMERSHNAGKVIKLA